MRKRKIRKIQSRITLSIKYSRLNLEITSLSEALKSKKRLSTKQKNELHQLLDDATYLTNIIVKTNRKKDYLLLEKVALPSLLKLLEREKSALFILYTIAITTIIDTSFPYSPQLAFFENLSLQLFGNKYTFNDISESYAKLKAVMYGDEVSSNGLPLSRSGGKNVSLHAIKKVFSFALRKEKRRPVKEESNTFVLQNRIAIKKAANQNTSRTPFEFSKKLAQRALFLRYASFSLGRVQFKEYTKVLMIEVNAERQIIARGLLEEWYDAAENSAKLRILTNFDNYIIEVIKEQLKN